MSVLNANLDANFILPLPANCGDANGLDIRLAGLIAEHDDLDCAISALLAIPACDDLLIKRLKKRKLHLKDEIALARLAPAHTQTAAE